MRISNSKKQLAKIISENGGWRDGAESAAQCIKGEISFWHDTATKRCGEDWCGSYLGSEHDIEFTGVKLPNWHQTILSRDEYFHLYPAPDAVAEAPEHVWTNPPTIEQLAAEYRNRQDYADRKQQEAAAAKAEAEAKLAELVAAGKAVGLVVSVAAPESELVITDWRDLQVGDEIEYTEGAHEYMVGKVGTVIGFDRNDEGRPVEISSRDLSPSDRGWPRKWRFIRRPTKEADNA